MVTLGIHNILYAYTLTFDIIYEGEKVNSCRRRQYNVPAHAENTCILHVYNYGLKSNSNICVILILFCLNQEVCAPALLYIAVGNVRVRSQSRVLDSVLVFRKLF